MDRNAGQSLGMVLLGKPRRGLVRQGKARSAVAVMGRRATKIGSGKPCPGLVWRAGNRKGLVRRSVAVKRRRATSAGSGGAWFGSPRRGLVRRALVWFGESKARARRRKLAGFSVLVLDRWVFVAVAIATSGRVVQSGRVVACSDPFTAKAKPCLLWRSWRRVRGRHGVRQRLWWLPCRRVLSELGDAAFVPEALSLAGGHGRNDSTQPGSGRADEGKRRRFVSTRTRGRGPGAARFSAMFTCMPLAESRPRFVAGPTLCGTCGTNVSEYVKTVVCGPGDALPCGHDASPTNLVVERVRVDDKTKNAPPR